MIYKKPLRNLKIALKNLNYKLFFIRINIMKPHIEIEYRARFDEKKYKELKKFFELKAKDLGEDNKDVFFFIMPDKLLKVVNNLSKRNAEIVLKLNKIGKGNDFEEIIIPIEQKYIDRAVRLLTEIKLTDNIMHSFQKRHNYLYKDVELSLKYSEVWGYHLELEKVIDDKSKISEAERVLQDTAKELGIRLMTDEELKEFTEKAEENYKKRD